MSEYECDLGPSWYFEPIERYAVDVMNEHLPALKNFILPGGSTISAQAHLSRCICRRAERRVVALNDEKYNLVVQYLNRLSDYLFVLSRDILHQEGINEVIWQKK
jgi:cob(I)alamin adenosyltransferase